MHGKGLYHGLLRADSIYVDKNNYQVVIGSFGFASHSNKENRGQFLGRKASLENDLFAIQEIIKYMG